MTVNAGTIIEIDPRLLKPNTWNFNELSPKNYAELVDDLRRDKRNHKPIIAARNADDSLEILDGEWTWKGANDAGLTIVVVEEVEADAFDRRRRTYKANRHGKENPLKEGRMFADMLRLREEAGEPISIRDLARALAPMTEVYIRRKLAYVELSEKAREDHSLPNDHEIAKLSERKVLELLGRGPAPASPAGDGPADADDDEPEPVPTTPAGGGGGQPGDLAEVADFKARFVRWPVEERKRFLSWAAAQDSDKTVAAGG